MESKPIFIFKIPRIPEIWASVRGYVNNTPDLTEEYHVMLVAHSGDEVEFECFNSPYKPEELTQLTELIEKMNKDYE